jgi:hypothetical protein
LIHFPADDTPIVREILNRGVFSGYPLAEIVYRPLQGEIKEPEGGGTGTGCIKSRVIIVVMRRPPTLTLVELLRSTMKQLEQSADFNPDEPALRGLRSSLVRTIAELNLRKAPQRKSPSEL